MFITLINTCLLSLDVVLVNTLFRKTVVDIILRRICTDNEIATTPIN